MMFDNRFKIERTIYGHKFIFRFDVNRLKWYAEEIASGVGVWSDSFFELIEDLEHRYKNENCTDYRTNFMSKFTDCK